MQRLFPDLDLLSQEYVLVQAWKKTAAYIRYHNWFADTLELDRAAADLPKFISRLSRRIRSERYETRELKIVPAPKSHPWAIDNTGHWRPVNARAVKIRPLAQVALSDQVVATAILLCLSERVESLQGDPTLDYTFAKHRAKISSYGNRLFCDFDPDDQSMIHRWGSAKLYRAYFQDYRSFLARPEMAALDHHMDGKTLVLQTDLKQFYDRALHYHMYQLVIVANNGAFGGSNAHVPKGEPFERQVFHTHGQPQASISFFEIDDIQDMKTRRQTGLAGGATPWKYPPAGY